MKSPAPPPAGQRIAKLLARAGIASRREVERMIAEGRVARDGETIATPATVLTSLRGVTVDGQLVKEPAPARLFRFHKPAGLLTTERDPKGRPTIYDRLPEGLPRLMPVGRLDLNTEGLLLLTTDGELKRQLELPATGVTRTYRARAFGEVSQEQLEELIHGITIEGVRYGSIDANLERRTGRNQWIELKLAEGKNREVRRILEHLGLQVSRLIRTSYGPFALGDLRPAAVDEIRQHDLVVFRRSLGKAPAVMIGADEHGSVEEAGKDVRPSRSEPSRPRRNRPASTPAKSAPRPPQSKQGTPASRPRAPGAAAAGEREALHHRPPRGVKPPRKPPSPPPEVPAEGEKSSRPKRGAGWAKPKPKPKARPSSRPTRRGGDGRRHPTSGRPEGTKR